jgi:cell division protein FtsN
MLPQFEVVIPEFETNVRADTAPRAVEQPGRYVLQAGSFRTLVDADRRQASLALLGVESNIQRVAIEDDVYHRVRIGPVEALGQLNEIRRRLRDARIETLLMQIPE